MVPYQIIVWASAPYTLGLVWLGFKLGERHPFDEKSIIGTVIIGTLVLVFALGLFLSIHIPAATHDSAQRAYIAYRVQINCADIDMAIEQDRPMPANMTGARYARCTGETRGYTQPRDYLDDDWRNFRYAFSHTTSF